MMGRCCPIAMVFLCCAAVCQGAFAADAPELAQWLPGESYAGGKQYDARLDRPVKLWGAGIPVKKAFAEITAQTGVDVTCDPAGDVNERVCLNAYLNRDAPPDLRSVLAQISWVMDCAITVSGEGEERKYFLMSTSVGGEDVIAKLGREEGRRQARETERNRVPTEQILKRREDLREALGLSREEAIDRYKGRDDLLLLAVLDPARRAMAELYISHAVEFDASGEARLLPLQRLSSLSVQERALLLNAVRPSVQEWLIRTSAAGQPVSIEGDPITWLSSLDPQVALPVGASEQGAWVTVNVFPLGIGGRPILSSLQVAGELTPEDQIKARRLAGDTFTTEEEDSLRREYWQKKHASDPYPEEAEARAQPVNLPEEIEQKLASLSLLPNLRESYTLWQIQEAVAKVSGMNLVSDCFWQSERDQRILYNEPEADREAPASALQALRAATGRVGAHWTLLSYSFPDHPYNTAWEWQGAGRFLIFRSADRDVWRAAFLPADPIRTLDAWVEPSLPAEGKTAPAVTPDWRAFGRRISDLTSAQIKWGGLLTYEDPTDFRNACRQSFRARMLSVATSGVGNPHVLRFLGSLSDDQWQQACTEGLRIGSDISLDVLLDRFRSRPHEHPAPWVVTNEQGEEVMVPMRTAAGERGFTAGDVLRVREGQGNWFDVSPGATFELQVIRQGKVRARFVLPARLVLRSGPTESIGLPKTAGK